MGGWARCAVADLVGSSVELASSAANAFGPDILVENVSDVETVSGEQLRLRVASGLPVGVGEGCQTSLVGRHRLTKRR